MNKEKYNIIYKHFAKPIYDMAMTYEKQLPYCRCKGC